MGGKEEIGGWVKKTVRLILIFAKSTRMEVPTGLPRLLGLLPSHEQSKTNHVQSTYTCDYVHTGVHASTLLLISHCQIPPFLERKAHISHLFLRLYISYEMCATFIFPDSSVLLSVKAYISHLFLYVFLTRCVPPLTFPIPGILSVCRHIPSCFPVDGTHLGVVFRCEGTHLALVSLYISYEMCATFKFARF